MIRKKAPFEKSARKMKIFLPFLAAIFFLEIFQLVLFFSLTQTERVFVARITRVQERSNNYKGAKSSSVQSMREDFIKQSLLVPVFYDGTDAGVDVAELFGRF